MSTISEKFAQFGVVPVVVLEDAKDAAPLAEVLIKGGLPCAEVTFRTEAAEESEQTVDLGGGQGFLYPVPALCGCALWH